MDDTGLTEKEKEFFAKIYKEDEEPQVLDILGKVKREERLKNINKGLGAVAITEAMLVAYGVGQSLAGTEVVTVTPPTKSQASYVIGVQGGLSYPNGTTFEIPVNAQTLPTLVADSTELSSFLEYVNKSEFKLDSENNSARIDRFGNLHVELVQEKTGNKVNATFTYSQNLGKLAQIVGVEEVNVIPDYKTSDPVSRFIDDPKMLPVIEGLVRNATGEQIPTNYSAIQLLDDFDVTHSDEFNFTVNYVREVRFLDKDGRPIKAVKVSEPAFVNGHAYAEDGNINDSDFTLARETWKQSIVAREQGRVDAKLTPEAFLLKTPDEALRAVGYLRSNPKVWRQEYNQTRLQELINQTSIEDLRDLLYGWTNGSSVLVLDTPDSMQYAAVALRLDGNMVPYTVPLTKDDFESIQRYR